MRVLVVAVVVVAAVYWTVGRGPDMTACRGNTPVAASALAPSGAVQVPADVVREVIQQSVPGILSRIDDSNGVAVRLTAATPTVVVTFDSAGEPIPADEYFVGFDEQAGLRNVRDTQFAGGDGKIAAMGPAGGFATAVISDCAGVLVMGAHEPDVVALTQQLREPAVH